MATDKRTNDSNVDWIEKALTENYIKYYEYSKFTNMKEINNGSVGSIFRANWKGTDTLLVIKSSYKLTVKEIVNEVFIIFIMRNDTFIDYYYLNLPIKNSIKEN